MQIKQSERSSQSKTRQKNRIETHAGIFSKHNCSQNESVPKTSSAQIRALK